MHGQGRDDGAPSGVDGKATKKASRVDEHDEFGTTVSGVEPVVTPELVEAADVVRRAVESVRSSARSSSSSSGDGSEPPWVPSYALANRYTSGAECVGWHADHLSELGPRPIIAGLTLGAARPFAFRRADQPGPSVMVVLPHNSLAIMVDDAQEEWEHAVPRVSDKTIGAHRVTGLVRYNLTFRAERGDMPDFGECKCGRPAALKCKGGRYVLMCAPYGGNGGSCGMWVNCPWANSEAARMRARSRGSGESS
jgi:hypothetical protein